MGLKTRLGIKCQTPVKDFGGGSSCCSWFCQTPLQLANPTQLQLVGEGVDFVLPLSQQQEQQEEPPPKSILTGVWH